MSAQPTCIFCHAAINPIITSSSRQSICGRCWVQSSRQHHKDLLFGLKNQASTLRLNLKDFLMAVQGKEYECTSCGQSFVFRPEKESLLSIQDFEAEVQCPSCRETLSHKRGSGRDTGQSHIQHGKCIKCGSETEYFPLPDEQHTFYCSECAKGYASSSY